LVNEASTPELSVAVALPETRATEAPPAASTCTSAAVMTGFSRSTTLNEREHEACPPVAVAVQVTV